MQRRIGRIASENEQLYSANQQLIEANESLAIDHQTLQAVQGQLGLVMTRLNDIRMSQTRRFKNGLIGILPSAPSLGSSQVPRRFKNDRQHNSARFWVSRTNRLRSSGPRLLRRVHVNHQDSCRRETALRCHGKASPVRSDDITNNRYTYAISFPAIPVQDMSFFDQKGSISPIFRRFTAISDPG
jgi:hypothetical protein